MNQEISSQPPELVESNGLCRGNTEQACAKGPWTAHETLQAIISYSPECIKLVAPDGIVLEINAAGLAIAEAERPDDVIGKSVFNLIAPEDQDRFRRMHQTVCRGRPARLLFQLVGLKHTRRWLETHAVPVPRHGTNGYRYAHLAITRDVTSQKREEDVTHLLTAIVESCDDAIVSKNLDGIIMSWNRGAERLFGYSEAEAIGKPITMLIPEGMPDEEPGILRRIRKGQRIEHYETVRKRKDGTLVDIALTVSPIKDGQGNVIGASKIARDISARKRVEADLQLARSELASLNTELERRIEERTKSLSQAVSQLEELSYTLSHDLRAPVRAMKGYATIALEEHDASLAPEVKVYLDRIIRCGTRMDNLISDVLTYSRLSRRELQIRTIDLKQLIGDIIDQFPELHAPKANISLLSPLHKVMGHESSLAQAISNLLMNAVKFVAAGVKPQVTIHSELRDGRVRLCINDNGIGIKPENQHRAFGVFERLHTGEHYEGTGIGLAIVRKALEKMGGSAGLESDGVSGCKFWLELPQAEQP